jgi:hypothetical protein
MNPCGGLFPVVAAPTSPWGGQATVTAVSADRLARVRKIASRATMPSAHSCNGSDKCPIRLQQPGRPTPASAIGQADNPAPMDPTVSAGHRPGSG